MRKEYEKLIRIETHGKRSRKSWAISLTSAAHFSSKMSWKIKIFSKNYKSNINWIFIKNLTKRIIKNMKIK